jgi:hypothetical protein
MEKRNKNVESLHFGGFEILNAQQCESVFLRLVRGQYGRYTWAQTESGRGRLLREGQRGSVSNPNAHPHPDLAPAERARVLSRDGLRQRSLSRQRARFAHGKSGA